MGAQNCRSEQCKSDLWNALCTQALHCKGTRQLRQTFFGRFWLTVQESAARPPHSRAFLINICRHMQWYVHTHTHTQQQGMLVRTPQCEDQLNASHNTMPRCETQLQTDAKLVWPRRRRQRETVRKRSNASAGERILHSFAISLENTGLWQESAQSNLICRYIHFLEHRAFQGNISLKTLTWSRLLVNENSLMGFPRNLYYWQQNYASKGSQHFHPVWEVP